jgi:hypothetical protein
MPVRVAVFIDGANVYRAFKTVFEQHVWPRDVAL